MYSGFVCRWSRDCHWLVVLFAVVVVAPNEHYLETIIYLLLQVVALV